jgi:lysozyme
MKVEEVYQQLKADEGVRYKIYEDHLGLATFGIGHLVTTKDPEYGKPIGTEVSEDRVRECFERDLDIAISECGVLYGKEEFGNFPEEVQQVLVNMMFNMGRPRLTQFKNFNRYIGERDWVRAAHHGRDSKWHRQVTNRAERLMMRLDVLKGVA